MNAEDALLAQEEKPKKRKVWMIPNKTKGTRRSRRDERRPKPPGGRFTSFTLLTALVDQVLIQIKD